MDMDKLQHMIDGLLGDIDSRPPPQQPGEFAIQRERLFEENARKIEQLKQARLQAQQAAELSSSS
jgi:hypothetical protein